MKFHCFGDEVKPVILLLSGTCCHWKRNFEHVLSLLGPDKPWFRKLAYRLAQKVADQNNVHRGKEWNNTWGFRATRRGREHTRRSLRFFLRTERLEDLRA